QGTGNHPGRLRPAPLDASLGGGRRASLLCDHERSGRVHARQGTLWHVYPPALAGKPGYCDAGCDSERRGNHHYNSGNEQEVRRRHRFAAQARFPFSRRKGIAKKNVEPCPNSLSAQMRPPCISTNFLVMLSPRPVPPNSLVMVASACRNSANMLSSWCWGIPMPVSATR